MDKNLIIDDATVVTMNPQRDILTHASVAISGEHIAAVGQAGAIRAQYPRAERIDGRGKVVLPGLINCHTHISMSLQKGITLAVPDGLYRVMWPVERSLTPDDCYVGALIGGAESVIKYVANTLSFLRVAAFSLSHVAFTVAVFTVADTMGVVGHWVALVLGNCFIIVLEGAIVIIQTLRLEYYEGFSRFFHGDGREFRPLQLKWGRDSVH